MNRQPRVPVAVTVPQDSNRYDVIVVCDDGTAWKYYGPSEKWFPLKGGAIPGSVADAQEQSQRAEDLDCALRDWNTARLAALSCPEERSYADALAVAEERLASFVQARK